VRGLLAIVAAGVVACVAPAAAWPYGWPLAPFDEQHPVRGFFDDPRVHIDDTGVETASFHFGVDIAAPGGTPVYAVAPGTVFREADAVAVRDGPHEFSYWHVSPAVPEHAFVQQHELLGWVKPAWGHVHFAESIDGRYVNPLRPGALEPFVDRTRPTVAAIELLGADPAHVTGTVGVVVDAYDTPPIAPPPPWQDAIVAPALVRWRLVGDDVADMTPWQVAVDFRRDLLPPEEFDAIYAPGTAQNKPDRPGRLLFWLDHALQTGRLEPGPYRLDVEAEDLAGNIARGSLRLVVVGAARHRTG
jgi:hypothetical protein